MKSLMKSRRRNKKAPQRSNAYGAKGEIQMEDVRSLIKVLKEELGEQAAIDLLPQVLTIVVRLSKEIPLPDVNPFEGVLTRASE